MRPSGVSPGSAGPIGRLPSDPGAASPLDPIGSAHAPTSGEMPEPRAPETIQPERDASEAHVRTVTASSRPLTRDAAPRTASAPRDHGGGLDAAMARHGGTRADWLDLSTGINPVPYPLPPIPPHAWIALPDRAAAEALVAAARAFWHVPDGAEVIPAPGLSALIARLPHALGADRIRVPGPTYNEYAASFAIADIPQTDAPDTPLVVVHPNNPTGRLWPADALPALAVIDESFCDVTPDASHVARTARPGTVVLKSFGKFWGLAGLRLGFAILAPGPIADRLRDALGPWAVSGPALAVGREALSDPAWAKATRSRLASDAHRLDALLTAKGAKVAGGTTLFRLYEVDDAPAWHDRLAQAHVLSRVFPYSRTWLRLGLPAPDRWTQLEAAL